MLFNDNNCKQNAPHYQIIYWYIVIQHETSENKKQILTIQYYAPFKISYKLSFSPK